MTKIVRKKPYKSMSVLELVSVRKELTEKIQQIDAILSTAAEALNDVKYSTNNSRRNVSDVAFRPQQNANFYVDQVPVSKEAPILAPIPANSPDQSSGFSIFDAEASFQQEEANSSNVTDSVEFDFNSQEVNKEIEQLKQGIQEVNDLNNHVQDS